MLAVLLAHEKQLPAQWLSAPPPAWNAPQGGSLGGLDGTTMALVGVGAIGTEVARRALAFGVPSLDPSTMKLSIIPYTVPTSPSIGPGDAITAV